MKAGLSTFAMILLYQSTVGKTVSSIAEHVYTSYVADKSLHENFYDILRSLCPKSVYCNGQRSVPDVTKMNASDNNELESFRESLVGCCKPCSCNPDCLVTNDCCVDAKPEEILGMAEASQRCLQTDLDQYRYIGISNQYSNFYLMVTLCGNKSSDNNITQKCERPNIAFMDEVVPVQSAATKRIYRNRYCAVCNGELNTSTWQVYVYIAKQVYAFYGQQVVQDIDELYSFVISTSSKAGTILFYPPKGEEEIARERRCFNQNSNKTSYCEHTIHQSSNSIANFIQAACSYKKVIFTKNNRVYNNIFCWLCTERDIYVMQTQGVCDSYELKRPSNMIGMLVWRKDLSSEADRGHQVYKEQATNCSCREWNDERMDMCRQIYCSMGHVFVACDCVKVLENIYGLPVMTVLRLKSVDSPRSWIPEETDISMSVIQAVQKTLRSTIRANFQTFPFMLFRHMLGDMPTYDMLVEITTGENVDTREVVKSLYFKLKEGIQVKANGVRYHMILAPVSLIKTYEKISFAKRPVQIDQQLFKGYGDNMTLMYVIPELFTKLKPTVIFGKHIFCNRIAISDEELALIKKSLKSYPSDYDIELALYSDEMSTYICLQDFISILRSKASTATSNACAKLMFLLIWHAVCTTEISN